MQGQTAELHQECAKLSFLKFNQKYFPIINDKKYFKTITVNPISCRNKYTPVQTSQTKGKLGNVKMTG